MIIPMQITTRIHGGTIDLGLPCASRRSATLRSNSWAQGITNAHATKTPIMTSPRESPIGPLRHLRPLVVAQGDRFFSVGGQAALQFAFNSSIKVAAGLLRTHSNRPEKSIGRDRKP